MLPVNFIFSIASIIISAFAIFLSLKTLFLQNATYKKNYIEENLFDIDCKGVLISNIKTVDDENKSNNEQKEEKYSGITKSSNGGYSVRVKDAMILEFVLVFSTSGRCFLLDSDITEIRLENSFKKVKITGFMSAKIIKNINGFASHGFTLKSMKFQYLMPKSFFASDDEFTSVVIESDKIKNGLAIFEASIRPGDVMLNKVPGVYMGIKHKIK